MDCVAGAKQHLADNSVDLIITDPPYGINGNTLDKHYNRNENFVIDGYVDVPKNQYAEFSKQWICEAARVLKPGGALYIVSGYTQLVHILNALHATDLTEKNHIIWKYNFGVYTKTKYVSSHYHILFYIKGGAKHTFNLYSRYDSNEKTDNGGSCNYQDREDVWVINREYKPGQIKNKNELPTALLTKIIQYSSNEGDVIADFFLGSFSTAKVAKGLNRQAIGFEINMKSFDHQIQQIKTIEQGGLLQKTRPLPPNTHPNQSKRLSVDDKNNIIQAYKRMQQQGKTKKSSIDALSAQFGRGYWSISNIIKE